ncbi:MAG: glycoside hydrolase family 95 protein [Akkermansiaceae bacterium]|jgi:alpha-L-fucosidase 2|nr:glycoside hydrolase family 95 protein [Akkermansiaceae bacterium]
MKTLRLPLFFAFAGPIAFFPLPTLKAQTIHPAKNPPAEISSIWFAAPARTLAKPRAGILTDGTQTDLAKQARLIDFHESLPTGNGRLGVMDCGGPQLHRIILNESTMWSGGNYDANQPDAWKHLASMRENLFRGDVGAARKILESHFTWRKGTPRFDPNWFGSYQTLGDLILRFPENKSDITGYQRDLNLRTGIITTRFIQNGITHTREVVVSKQHEVIAIRLRTDPPASLSLLATLARPAQAKLRAEASQFVMEGQLTCLAPGATGIRYQGLLAAIPKGGTVKTDHDGIHLEKADEAVIFISAGTDMDDRSDGFRKTIRERLEAAMKIDFDTLRDQAAADHRSFMDRCRLEFPIDDTAKLPTPERIKRAAKKPDPGLDAIYFQFGRHLLVSASRPDSRLPANLQGIWAEEINTPWRGDFHSNINLQMNYWAAEPTGLSDCHLPLMRLIEETATAGRATAKAYYNAPGWICFHTLNPWGYTAPSNTSAGSGSTCGAWMTQHIWTHYDYTRDTDFLREHYPTLKEACEFFLATLIPDPKNGWLVTSPSNSPENHYRIPGKSGKIENHTLTYGATYDMQILRDLFLNTASAARVLEVDPEFVAKLDATRAKLAPTRTGKDGRILEWIEDYEEAEPRHRHVSHLWGLHPGNEITAATPELIQGAKLTLEARGDASTGWSMAWKSNFWARLRDGDRSHRLLILLITRGAPNLFCLHPPFQIDGNYGGTAAITEMLLQTQEMTADSQPVIDLLPALPSAWPEGKITGLKARGGASIDLLWKAGKLVSATITPSRDGPIHLRHAGKSTHHDGLAGKALKVGPDLTLIP